MWKCTGDKILQTMHQKILTTVAKFVIFWQSFRWYQLHSCSCSLLSTNLYFKGGSNLRRKWWVKMLNWCTVVKCHWENYLIHQGLGLHLLIYIGVQKVTFCYNLKRYWEYYLITYFSITCWLGLVVSMSASHTVGREFAPRQGHTNIARPT